jgi:dihydrofolate synthase/folylpolyglutamate synthase
VITEIEREHVEFLGRRLGSIAAEKAGVMRRGAPCVIGASRPAARRALARAARSCGAVPVWLDREATWSVTSHTPRGLTMDLRTSQDRYSRVRVGLLGRHQARNAALAVLAAERLRALGFPISTAAIRDGLARASWPGRCEWRPGSPGIFLDGAHTPGSAAALREALRELFPRRRLVLVFGALRDKDAAGMARMLFPEAARVFLVRPREERGLSPEETLARIPRALAGRCTPAAGVAAALAGARRAAGRSGVVVVAGSLFLVGEALSVLAEAKGS